MFYNRLPLLQSLNRFTHSVLENRNTSLEEKFIACERAFKAYEDTIKNEKPNYQL